MPKPRLLKPLRLLACIAALGAATGYALEESSGDVQAPSAAPPVERPALQSRSEAAQTALRQQLPAHEQVELEGEDSHFLALWLPANVGAPKGLVIMLPSEGESADAPGVIGSLRRGLADDGWHTLSISLPDVEVPISARAREPASEPDTEATATTSPEIEPPTETKPEPEPSGAGYLPEETASMPGSEIAQATPPEEVRPQGYPEQINARVDAALFFAQSRYTGGIVLLGHGTGAYWASHYLQQKTPPEVQQLVIIQPRAPAHQEQRLESLISGLKLATADFYYKGNRATEAAADARRDASRRLRHPSYTQVKLQPLPADRKSERIQLQRRVRGWLDSNQP